MNMKYNFLFLFIAQFRVIQIFHRDKYIEMKSYGKVWFNMNIYIHGFIHLYKLQTKICVMCVHSPLFDYCVWQISLPAFET